MSKIQSSRGAASPTPTSASYSSSFDLLSRPDSDVISQRRWADSDDEIVWGDDASSSSSDDGSSCISDNQYVVLSRPRSPGDVLASAGLNGLVPDLEALSLRNKSPRVKQRSRRSVRKGDKSTTTSPEAKVAKPSRRKGTTDATLIHEGKSKDEAGRVVNNQRRRARRLARVQDKLATNSLAIGSYPTPTPTPSAEKQFTSSLPRATPPHLAPAPHGGTAQPRSESLNTHLPPGTGFTARPIVDDCSEAGDFALTSPVYEEAVTYVSTFLSNPNRSSHSRLTLLQSLIVELGLYSPTDLSLPCSMTAAKALLKARAFLNIREYLAVRDQGQDAVKRVMHPSRSALIKDIRKKRNTASLTLVKKSGLNVLLVSCF